MARIGLFAAALVSGACAVGDLTLPPSLAGQAPVLESFTPTSGFADTRLVLKGRALGLSTAGVTVRLGTTSLPLLRAAPDGSELEVLVPVELPSGEYPIEIARADGPSTVSTDPFVARGPGHLRKFTVVAERPMAPLVFGFARAESATSASEGNAIRFFDSATVRTSVANAVLFRGPLQSALFRGAPDGSAYTYFGPAPFTSGETGPAAVRAVAAGTFGGTGIDCALPVNAAVDASAGKAVVVCELATGFRVFAVIFGATTVVTALSVPGSFWVAGDRVDVDWLGGDRFLVAAKRAATGVWDGLIVRVTATPEVSWTGRIDDDPLTSAVSVSTVGTPEVRLWKADSVRAAPAGGNPPWTFTPVPMRPRIGLASGFEAVVTSRDGRFSLGYFGGDVYSLEHRTGAITAVGQAPAPFASDLALGPEDTALISAGERVLIVSIASARVLSSNRFNVTPLGATVRRLDCGESRVDHLQVALGGMAGSLFMSPSSLRLSGADCDAGRNTYPPQAEAITTIEATASDGTAYGWQDPTGVFENTRGVVGIIRPGRLQPAAADRINLGQVGGISAGWAIRGWPLVPTMALSPDDSRLLVATTNASGTRTDLAVVELATSRVRRVPNPSPGRSGELLRLGFLGNGRAVGLFENTIVTADLTTDDTPAVSELSLGDDVATHAFFANGRAWIARGADDFDRWLWSLDAAGTFERRSAVAGLPLNSVLLESPDGVQVAEASLSAVEGTVRLRELSEDGRLDLRTGNIGQVSGTTNMRWSPDGAALFLIGDDKMLRIE